VQAEASMRRKRPARHRTGRHRLIQLRRSGGATRALGEFRYLFVTDRRHAADLTRDTRGRQGPSFPSRSGCGPGRRRRPHACGGYCAAMA
jgi:hypothetical protein